MTHEELPLRERLNVETGRLCWTELERYFARGVVVKVSGELDLVEVAVSVAADDLGRFQAWVAAGQVGRATDHDAVVWRERESEFWAIVTAPWVLIQEITD